MKINISSCMYSDVGDRNVNEDAVKQFKSSDSECFILCDGLGGMGMGDIASDTVVKAFENVFINLDNKKKYIDTSFSAAQDILLAKQKSMNAESKMKTTAVALLIRKNKAYIGHIGDSRLYHFRKGKIVKRTLDHSIPQMLATLGDIREEDIRKHPKRSIVLKTMGIPWDEPMYEAMKKITIKSGDAFLMCTDGFWENIYEKDMENLYIDSNSPETWLEKMKAIVKKNSKGIELDNNSAIAVWIQ